MWKVDSGEILLITEPLAVYRFLEELSKFCIGRIVVFIGGTVERHNASFQPALGLGDQFNVWVIIAIIMEINREVLVFL